MKSSNFLNETAYQFFFKPFLFCFFVILLATSCEDKKETPNPGKEEIQTLELTFDDLDSGVRHELSMVPHHGVGPWVFQTMAFDPFLGIPHERNYVIPEAEIAKVDIYDDGKGNFTITDSDGNPTEWKGKYTVADGPAENEITYTGTLSNGISHFEFKGITDPAPLVIIAVAGIGAAICALIITVNDCEESTAILQSIEACRENGGKPQLTTTTTFGIRLSPFQIGCGVDCEFECK